MSTFTTILIVVMIIMFVVVVISIKMNRKKSNGTDDLKKPGDEFLSSDRIKDTKKSIHDLALHELTVLDLRIFDNSGYYTTVTRVPGGWIYANDLVERGSLAAKISRQSAVFVPFSDEFRIQ